ncbi:MAG TPA: peptide ABC transporter substrate-binding protein [Candidatus Baltobacteraceae bacterium]|nr:peptide ABC transporter substrate-binding protein [Candidatus Baltobacteraceae bacterium]
MNRRAFAAVLACVLTACSGGGGATHGHRHPWTVPGTFRWADGEDIDNLNPLLSTETLVNDLSAFTMGYFFVFDDTGKPIPSLCLEVPTRENQLISADGKSITFKLRRGVVWHDGKPFTSADVAFTVKTILDPKTNVLTRDGWDLIDRVDTPDPYTAIFRLKRPYAAFINRYFTPVGNPAILPKHILDGQDVNHSPYNSLPVGLGPFRYVRWTRANEVVMEAFPKWWGGRPKLQRVIFKVIPDANTMLTALQTHEIDAYVRVPTASHEQVEKVANTRTVAVDSTTYNHVDFNVTGPILSDPQVRQALARAIDRTLLWSKVFHRSGYPACTPISHLNWAYDPHARCYPFDLAAAAKQLQADGWIMGSDGLRHKNGRALRFAFAGNTGNPGLDTTVLLIQQWFKKIGAGIEYFRYPADKLFASYAAGGIVATRHYDLSSYAWSLPPDPDLTNLIACSRISPKGQNYMGYCNPDVDAALSDALVRYDRAQRKRDYLRVQEDLARDVPFIVLFQRTDRVTYNDDFHGLKPGPVMTFWNPQQISN